MDVIIDSATAHWIYTEVAANRAKPKESKFQLTVDEKGVVISIKDIS